MRPLLIISILHLIALVWIVNRLANDESGALEDALEADTLYFTCVSLRALRTTESSNIVELCRWID